MLDRLGRFDEAFEHLQTAARVQSASDAAQHLDRAAVFCELDDARARFATEVLRDLETHDFDDGLPTPVSLIGFYRSGTTLMEQVFATHPAAITSDEADLVPRVVQELSRIAPGGSVAERILVFDRQGVLRLRAAYWERARELFGDTVTTRVLLDKTAINVIHLGVIKGIFPRAKFVFAVRDPRDACLSSFMQPFTLTPLTVQLRSWEGTARFYRAIFDFWTTMKSRITSPVLELRYEDLVRDFRAQATALFRSAGLDWVDAAESFYLRARGRAISTPSFDAVTQLVYDRSIGRWRHYAAHFEPLRAELDVAIRYFGYEP